MVLRMIPQIDRLTRSLHCKPAALAIAVYAERRGARLVPIPASSRGYEGVACVDDVARAAILFLNVWRRCREAAARNLAIGYLEFLLHMQEQDGGFVNFAINWAGDKNTWCETSRPGGAWWGARALRALAAGSSEIGDERYASAFRRGAPWLCAAEEDSRISSISLLAMVNWWRATRSASVRRAILKRAAGLAEQRRFEPASLSANGWWGHIEEGALAVVGGVLGDEGLVDASEANARRTLLPVVRGLGSAPSLLPYDVSSMVFSLGRLRRVRGHHDWIDAIDRARSWYLGENAASSPIYDPQRGCVHDGIDNGVINRNSGGEANIEGGLALMEWSSTGASTELARRPPSVRTVLVQPRAPERQVASR